MRINNNIMALNAHRQLGMNQAGAAKSMERLSSGFRINRAGDDAAGLAISEKMRGQIRGLKQASRNAQDGISLIQTAEGALNETHAILQRMRELAVQSATDTNTSSDRGEIQKEIDQLAEEISRISNTTEFNTKNLMAGGLNILFHIGANEQQNVTLNVGAMDARTLGVAASSIFTTIEDGDGIVGIDNVSEMLGDAAKITVSDKVDAAVAFDRGTVAGAVTDASSAYTGAVSETLGFKVTAVDETDPDAIVVTEIEINGTKYSVNSDGEFDIGNGVKFTIADDENNAIGQGGTIGLTAESYKMTLQDDTDDVGKAVTIVNNGLTSVTVGDAATGQTATVYFDFSTMAEGSKNITQGETKSTAASVDPFGNVVTKAEVKKGINVSTQAKADGAIKVIDDAIVKVSAERSKLGAIQNRLEHTIANLGTSAENLQAAESRIRDLDMAEEIMAFTKNNILQQAATAMLAQANMAPQSVLQLLG